MKEWKRIRVIDRLPTPFIFNSFREVEGASSCVIMNLIKIHNATLKVISLKRLSCVGNTFEPLYGDQPSPPLWRGWKIISTLSRFAVSRCFVPQITIFLSELKKKKRKKLGEVEWIVRATCTNWIMDLHFEREIEFRIKNERKREKEGEGKEKERGRRRKHET